MEIRSRVKNKPSDKKNKNKKRKNKGKIALISLIVLTLVGAGTYVFRKPLAVMAFDLFLSGQVEKKLDKSYAPLEGEVTNPVSVVKQEQLNPFSILLLGIDQREHEPSRSDTMIYSVVRPKDSKVLLISIPRDTYTEIIGKDKKDKINHAYAYGGEKMAKDTVKNFIGHDLDYYAAINFEGLREVVDALGGIKLPITKDIVNKEKDHEKFTIKAGKPLYDGQEALNYVRYREDSGVNRTIRHQIFLNAMVDRMMQLDQVMKIPELMDMLGDDFKTDMTPSSIVGLAKQIMLGDRPEISSFSIVGEGKRMHGVYYDIANEEDVAYANELIDNWSNPDTKPEELLKPELRPLE